MPTSGSVSLLHNCFCIDPLVVHSSMRSDSFQPGGYTGPPNANYTCILTTCASSGARNWRGWLRTAPFTDGPAIAAGTGTAVFLAAKSRKAGISLSTFSRAPGSCSSSSLTAGVGTAGVVSAGVWSEFSPLESVMSKNAGQTSKREKRFHKKNEKKLSKNQRTSNSQAKILQTVPPSYALLRACVRLGLCACADQTNINLG